MVTIETKMAKSHAKAFEVAVVVTYRWYSKFFSHCSSQLKEESRFRISFAPLQLIYVKKGHMFHAESAYLVVG